MVVNEVYQHHELSKEMLGWRYMDATTPCYFDRFGDVFFLDCLVALLAFLSFLRDRFHHADGTK